MEKGGEIFKNLQFGIPLIFVVKECMQKRILNLCQLGIT